MDIILCDNFNCEMLSQVRNQLRFPVLRYSLHGMDLISRGGHTGNVGAELITCGRGGRRCKSATFRGSRFCSKRREGSTSRRLAPSRARVRIPLRIPLRAPYAMPGTDLTCAARPNARGCGAGTPCAALILMFLTILLLSVFVSNVTLLFQLFFFFCGTRSGPYQRRRAHASGHVHRPGAGRRVVKWRGAVQSRRREGG